MNLAAHSPIIDGCSNSGHTNPPNSIVSKRNATIGVWISPTTHSQIYFTKCRDLPAPVRAAKAAFIKNAVISGGIKIAQESSPDYSQMDLGARASSVLGREGGIDA